MTLRERLMKVFNGEIPDITPWFADLSYWYDSQKVQGLLPSQYKGEKGYLKLHADNEVGVYLYPPSVWKEENSEKIITTNVRQGHVTTTTISTPAGDLKSVSEYLPGSFSTGIKEHFVKTIDDLNIMSYIYRNRKIEPFFDDFIRIDKLWGEYGVPVLLAPICVSAFQSLVSRWSGVEMSIILMSDYPEDFQKILEEIQNSNDKIFDIICDSPAEFVAFPENLSGDITSPALLKQYALPCWEKRISQLHAADKYVLLHNDGSIKSSLPVLVAETGLDAIEAVTPAPVGDLSLEDIRNITKDRKIVWGCLPGALFSRQYKEEFFIDYVRKIKDIFPLGCGFVLGVADQVPPDADFSRVKMVSEIIAE